MAASTRQLAELPAAAGRHLGVAWRALRNRSASVRAALSALPADKQRTMVATLLFGASIFCTLWSFRVNTLVMGNAALGVGIYAPLEGSPEMLEKLRLRWWSDALFYFGQAFALGAVVAQCWEPILLLFGRNQKRR